MTVHNPLEANRPEFTIKMPDGTEDRISIIIVHNDRPEYLSICLQSIAVTSVNNNYEIIVVDNGSGQESQDYLDSIKDDVKIVKNNKNLYWSVAANKGAAIADKNSKYLVFMHYDNVVINPAWLDLLVNACETQGSGMIGVEAGKYEIGGKEVQFIQENICIFSRECWDDIKPWPEELKLIGHAFLMCLKAQNKGYKPHYTKNPIAHHYKAYSFNYNEWEVISEEDLAKLPKMIQTLQLKMI